MPKKEENEGKPHPNCCTQEASSIFESDADYEMVNFKHDDTIAWEFWWPWMDMEGVYFARGGSKNNCDQWTAVNYIICHDSL